MKRKILLAILVSALAVTLCTSAIRPAKAYINNYQWFGQEHYYDPYWGSYYITVFQENTNATLLVTVYNSYWWASSLNISAVKVYMDWNQNYSSTEVSVDTPFAMPYATYHTFTITFTVPSVSVASNLFRHGWTIYVEEVNATSGPKQVTLHDSWSGTGFTVYSTVQKEAMMLYDEINALFNAYYWGSFGSVEAQNLWNNGTLYYNMGEDNYRSGNFDEAKTQYTTALNLLKQAITTEKIYDQNWQDHNDNYNQQMDTLDMSMQQALIAKYNAEAEAALKEANASMRSADAEMKTAEAQFALAQAAMTQAYAWIVFGIGFVIFGIAAVVWASKRPSPQ
jgi:hypothetical protein